ncbi:MAG: stage III sporulation protein AE [Clostridiales bacterium]|nr:stage III sporulation protein AE [Clostridiales bacterium]
MIIAVFTLPASGKKPPQTQQTAVAVCPSKNAEKKGSVPESVDDLLDKLDFGDIDSLLGALDSGGLEIFGFSSIVERIRAIATGEVKNDFGSVITYVLAILGVDVLKFLPMFLSVLAIILAYNIINSVKGKFASESVEKVVYFATGAIALCVVVGYFANALASAVKFVASVKTQINMIAPILMTLMTASGASASASVYTPSIAILGSGMTNAVTYLAFPALLMALVFDIIGSISTSVKLDKTAEFFRSACKWFLGTAFFLFIAVIGVSGITASVRDGVSVRAAKFAMSKYVPVIGGYLSQGFDFIMAGNVLIKNALGSTAVILILLTVIPVVAELAVFTLTLKLTAAIAQPLGGDKFSNALTSMAKSSSTVAAVVVAMAFLYILFLSMIICTGNVGL